MMIGRTRSIEKNENRPEDISVASRDEDTEAPKSSRILRGKMRELLTSKSHNKKQWKEEHGHVEENHNKAMPNSLSRSIKTSKLSKKHLNSNSFGKKSAQYQRPTNIHRKSSAEDNNYASHDSRVVNYGSMGVGNANVYGIEDINSLNKKMDSLFRDSREKRVTPKKKTSQRINPKIEQILQEHELIDAFRIEDFGNLHLHSGPDEIDHDERIHINERVTLVLF